MIFQDALSALNPVSSVGDQISEMFRIHQGLGRKDSQEAAIDVMRRVKIPGAAERVNDYPHQFSGGMRQRIMIAMMIALKPAVLIADEPTTALDVTVQSQIMDLLQELKEETNMGLILITHDLGVVADVAERILVMYAGRTMERGSVDEIYSNTANPYTYGLPEVDPQARPARGAPAGHQGPASEPVRSTGRVRLQPALPDGDQPVPSRGATSVARGGPGPHEPVLVRTGGRSPMESPEPIRVIEATPHGQVLPDHEGNHLQEADRHRPGRR